MCGRYNITVDPKGLMDVLQILDQYIRIDPFEPRYNIAPSEPPLPEASTRKAERRLTRVPIVRVDDGHLAADAVIWPLVPVWSNGEVPKYSTANARAETMHEKNSFRHAWQQGQRCLVVASGFYEWQDDGGKSKQPWCIEPANDEFFTFGGLWEESNGVLSCTIVTMPANPLMREIHNAGKNKHRMPLILDGDVRANWLNGDEAAARSVIKEYPADEMDAYKISTMVNNPGADSSKVIERRS